MEKNCCEPKNNQKIKNGIFSGIFYGILPHTFCILFIVFSVLGVTAFSAFLRPLMLKSYFFYLLIVLSFVFAAVSAVVYLKRINNLSFLGIKRKWKYLSILFGTTIAVNIILFFIVFPAIANINIEKNNQVGNYPGIELNEKNNKKITLKVEIPCSGHAALISDELKKIDGVGNIKFRLPNLFDVTYDSVKVDVSQITGLNVFSEYKATIIE